MTRPRRAVCALILLSSALIGASFFPRLTGATAVLRVVALVAMVVGLALATRLPGRRPTEAKRHRVALAAVALFLVGGVVGALLVE